MSLTTRPRPKAHHRKRQAMHHKRGKHYMKAYLPYLPMLGIVGLGVLAARLWQPAGGYAGTNPLLATTRLGSLTGSSSSMLYYLALGVTFAAFAVFVLTHWYRVHRLLNRGEMFMAQHPWFDISVVFVATAGVLLVRA